MRGGGDFYAFVMAEQNGTTTSYSPNTTDNDHSVPVLVRTFLYQLSIILFLTSTIKYIHVKNLHMIVNVF